MDRDGYYAVYKGKEYQLIIKLFDENIARYELLSFESDDVINGFIQEYGGKYRKLITKSQMDNAYSVSTMCKYKGFEFQVLLFCEENDTYEIAYIAKVSPIPVEKLGFVLKEPGVYKKCVKRENLDSIYEVKSSILDLI